MKRGLSNKLIKGEKGQALLIVMVLTLVSGLIVSSMLGNMQTGLRTGKEVYEENMYLSYAADSGVEDGLWQVKNKQLPNLFSDYDQYGYYDYSSSYEWGYNLADEYTRVVDGQSIGMVNGKEVNVTFQNVWMPKDISAPSPSVAESIADESRLAIYGSMSGASATEYQIKIYYYYNDTTPSQPDYDPGGANLRVQKVGIWLPPGFSYEDTTNLSGACAPSSEVVSPYKGGEAVVWSFGSSPLLSVFPSGGTSVNPMVKSITFQISGPEGRTPGTALAWIVSTGVSGISYSWDSSVKVHKITSVASDGTNEYTVEAYSAMTDMLRQGAAISGDYCSIGNTLMTETSDYKYRDRLFKQSSAIVQSTNPDGSFYVPPDAHVDFAYLFWTGWLENAAVWGDDCSNFDNWTRKVTGSPPNQVTDWAVSSGRFRGHHYGSDDTYRTLTMTVAVDLHYYAGQTVYISWQQSKGGTLESDDGLDFAFSGDGGLHWSDYLNPPNGAFRDDISLSTFTYTIPTDYLTDSFMIKFCLVGCNQGSGGSLECVYIDNISITLSGSPVENARANQVMFNGNKIIADPNTDPFAIRTQTTGSSLTYRCMYDVTSLILGMIGSGTLGSNGSGAYTVGHVMDWPGSYNLYNYDTGALEGTTAFPLGTPAYKEDNEWVNNTQLCHSAWSLIIIYSSPETQGHQLYLFYDNFAYANDNVNLDFDFDGQGGGTIEGFIAPEAIKDEDHAARLTVFIGEGDDWICGTDFNPSQPGPEYIQVKGTSGTATKLWDGKYSVRCPGSNTPSSPLNPWNDMSLGFSASGIDIDTFTVTYPTIRPGDIWAQIDLHTGTDNWDLVYIILSFRSEIVPAGTISYIVRQ